LLGVLKLNYEVHINALAKIENIEIKPLEPFGRLWVNSPE